MDSALSELFTRKSELFTRKSKLFLMNRIDYFSEK